MKDSKIYTIYVEASWAGRTSSQLVNWYGTYNRIKKAKTPEIISKSSKSTIISKRYLVDNLDRFQKFMIRNIDQVVKAIR